MKLVGDLHGISRIPGIMRSFEDEALCVGDVGIGFDGIGDRPCLSKRFWFMRGNHDKPEACLAHPQYAVDFGMWREMFLIAGARSVDQAMRREGISWWRDEELTYEQCQQALDLYESACPSVVVSHDCPFSLHGIMKEIAERIDPFVKGYGAIRPYNQVTMMDKMLEIHKPDYWFFGHWHCAAQFDIEGVRFRCLGIAEVIDAPAVGGHGVPLIEG